MANRYLKIGKYIECGICKKPVYVIPSIKNKKYCSRDCVRKGMVYSNLFEVGHKTNLGRICKEITKIKISNSQIGKKRTIEVKEKLRKAHLGKKLSINHIKGIIATKKRGPESPFWIKDRSMVIGRHNRNFHDPVYKQWRRQVCNRDDWKCRINNEDCKGRLEAHHIFGWKSHPELRYEVNNGITLCHFHHPRKRKDEVRFSHYFKQLVKAKM